MAQQQFDAQMDQTITRRVQDAKNAGVHPLYALGAASGASPTISTGQGRGNPAGNALTSMANTLNSLETNKAQAARDHAQAQLFDSERKRIEQDLNGRGQDAEAQVKSGEATDAIGRTIIPMGNDPAQLSITRPAEDTAQKAPGVRAGETPVWVDVRGADGLMTRTLNPELEWDELIHPGVIVYGWNRFWRGMQQNLAYAKRKLKEAGLSDQQILNQVNKIKKRAQREFSLRSQGRPGGTQRNHRTRKR